ncbi:MAG: DUF1566 domain-containing protein [Magnetococcales bacterium]|nr:DUF1566 domain-containing protein [Magnetococcales bacterium]
MMVILMMKNLFIRLGRTRTLSVFLVLIGLMIQNGWAEEGNAPVPKTGQTQPYHNNDDGDLETGVAWPTPRFSEHDDGTVTDELTGLVWMKNANCWGNQLWNQALDTIAGLNAGSQHCSGYTGNHTDWRLPNIEELESLVDLSQRYPALPSGHPFSGVQSYNYWSATTAGSTGAWYVYLSLGYVGSNYTYAYDYVWPVRGGP